MTDRQQRFTSGKEILDAIDGDAGAKVIDALTDVSPDAPRRRLPRLPSRTERDVRRGEGLC